MPACPRLSIAAAAVALSVAALTARAQSDALRAGPPAGTWGAELSYGAGSGVSLLRFTSPRAAWLLGATFHFARESSDELIGLATVSRVTRDQGSVQVRAGRRWYAGEPSARLRPTATLGLAGSYSSLGSGLYRQGSVFGELGAAYFFNPHVSLGTAGELAVSRSQRRSAFSGRDDLVTDQWIVGGNLVRLNAAVYF